jgi:hypothetical protein
MNGVTLPDTMKFTKQVNDVAYEKFDVASSRLLQPCLYEVRTEGRAAGAYAARAINNEVRL